MHKYIWDDFQGNDDEWDLLVYSMDNPSIFQISQWANFKKNMGWTARRFIATTDRGIVVAIQFLVKSRLGIGLAWAPGGPIFRKNMPDFAYQDFWQSFSKKFTSVFNKKVVRGDCNLPYRLEHENIFCNFLSRPNNKINSQYTSLIDTQKFLTNNTLSKHHSWSLKKAKQALIIWSFDKSEYDIESYSKIIKSMNLSKNLRLPFSNPNDLISLIHSGGEHHTTMLVGYINDIPICCCLTLNYANQSFYLSAGTTNLGKSTYSSFLMIKELISYLRSIEIDTLDFGGLSLSNPSLSGVDQFKLGFGGATYRRLGEWEMPSSSFAPLLLNLLIKTSKIVNLRNIKSAINFIKHPIR